MAHSSKKNSRCTSSKPGLQRKKKQTAQLRKHPTKKVAVRNGKGCTEYKKKQVRFFPRIFQSVSQTFQSKMSKKRRKRGRKGQKLLVELLLSTLVAASLVYIVSLFTFALPQVTGYGMMNELEEGDRLFVNRLGKINRFSLVYFRVPGRKDDVSIRRVVGLPGEEVVYKEDRLWVNGEEKAERFLIAQVQDAKKEGYQLTKDFTSQSISGTERGVIPEGKYLVLGDNRTFASDSRFYGLVDEQDMIGVASMKLFPLHEMMKL